MSGHLAYLLFPLRFNHTFKDKFSLRQCPVTYTSRVRMKEKLQEAKRMRRFAIKTMRVHFKILTQTHTILSSVAGKKREIISNFDNNKFCSNKQHSGSKKKEQ